jgi:hypothetical protein
MRLSEARASHLAQLIMKSFKSRGFAFPQEHLAYQEIKKVLPEFFEGDGGLDAKVRHRIQSMSRKVPENSREWEILYRKYMEEERRKKKPSV